MQSEKILSAVKQASLTMQRYNWEQGVAAQAFLEAGDAETAILMVVESVHRQTADGRCSQIGEPLAATDPCSVGEALIDACEQTKEPDLLRAKDKLLHWALSAAPRNADGLVYHLCDRQEIWVDSMYMLPPFLARAGYCDEALQQLNGYWRLLWNSENGLLAHRWDDSAKRFVRKDAWAVGNGWAAAGMVRVRSLLPADYEAERQQITLRLKKLLETAV